MSLATVTPTNTAYETLAGLLQKLTGNVVNVSYQPDMFLDGDSEARGHIYSAELSLDMDEDSRCMILDDRRPAPLEVQLAEELRRIGRLYSDLATKTGNCIAVDQNKEPAVKETEAESEPAEEKTAPCTPLPATKESYSAVMQRMGGVTCTPAVLREMAKTFYGREMFTEAEEVSRMAIILLLRMHYIAAYEKQCSSMTDIETLLRKLQNRNIVTLDQRQFACNLLAEVDNVVDAKRAKKMLQMADYLIDLLQRS